MEKRYQIRLYRQALDEFFTAVADGAWRELGPMLPGQLAPRAHAAVREVVTDQFTHHLQRYDNCGSEIFCDECLDFRPLTGPGDPMEWDDTQRADAVRYQLFVEPGLRQFIDELAGAIWDRLAQIGAPANVTGDTRDLHRLVLAIREEMAPYVYYNTECGTRDVCGRARVLPLFG